MRNKTWERKPRKEPGNPERRTATSSKQRGAQVIPLSGRRSSRAYVLASTVDDVGREKPVVGRRRIQAVMVAVAVAGTLLGARAAQLSFTDASRYEAIAEEAGLTHVSQQTLVERGDILSADGRKLATSLKAADIIATPYQVEDPEKTARSLHEALGGEEGPSVSDIESSLRKTDEAGAPGGYSVVATVDPESAARVMELGLSGIDTAPTADRVYPDGAVASQMIGHLGDYGKPYGGVEARYDGTLSAGDDVRLTIDAAVQQKLESSLSKAMDEYGAKSAMGVVMRVDDGAVVALANSPGYDNADYTATDAELQRDRVLTDSYEPGSTFKPFTFAAALEEGALSESDTFTVPDEILVADRVIHDSEPHVTETMYPREILQKSSNVGTIQIAQGLGGQTLDRYIRDFGFGEKTGVDLWGENAGTTLRYEDWSGSSIGNIPIGQGLTTTPLQLAAAYATLANGGLAVAPHVSGGVDPEEGRRRVISEDTSAIVRGMLQSVVEQGTGRYAQIPGYNVAGKTGTSQKVDPETGVYGEEYVASFAGFAPAGDPEFVTLIVVDEPQESIWGEQVAAPAFAEVMDFTLQYFNVPPDRTEEATR